MTHNQFWENKVWHHLVHERLGEVLFYYLVAIDRFAEPSPPQNN
jgi:hypothetical protein